MKRIAFATSYYVNNYGTVLQTYATQELLKKCDVEPELICVKGFWREIRKKRVRYFIKSALTSAMAFDKAGMLLSRMWKKAGFGKYSDNLRKRDRLFDDFRDEKLGFSPKYMSLRELGKEVADRYAAVVVGSDQLWLPSNIVGDYYTLSFVPDGVKRISYSTSFGIQIIPKEFEERIARFLREIECLSVREESGKRIIERLTGQDALVVADPVLMLSDDEWSERIKDEPLVGTDYILCYFLGKRKEGRDFADKIRKITGFEIVSMPNLERYVLADKGYADRELYEVSPFDFLNLIKHAKYVCTDSFHCLAFSILFHKSFFAFRKYYPEKENSTNGRLDNIVGLLGIKDRIIEDTLESGSIMKLLQSEIDYENVDGKLEEIKRVSFGFLKEALSEI